MAACRDSMLSHLAWGRWHIPDHLSYSLLHDRVSDPRLQHELYSIHSREAFRKAKYINRGILNFKLIRIVLTGGIHEVMTSNLH